jgi:hypothetical protein
MNNQPISSPGKVAAKSIKSSHFAKRTQYVAPVRIAKAEVAPTIFGVEVPKALSFSRLTRFLSPKDESLDQPPAPIPSFPTVAETSVQEEESDQTIDSAAIEDERSLLLLNEAERFAEFSENKTLSEIARGSLNRTMDLAKPGKLPTGPKMSHNVMIILALCVGVLVTCGYFVVTYILDDMRFRNSSPRFGSRF